MGESVFEFGAVVRLWGVCVRRGGLRAGEGGGKEGGG